MESVQVLIRKLTEQFESGATAAQMLSTVQQLQSLLVQPAPAANSSTRSVHVTMPMGAMPFENLVRPEPAPIPEAAPVSVPEPAPVANIPTPEPEAPAETIPEPYALRKPEVLAATPPAPVANPGELPFETAPAKAIQREIHELIGGQTESLNDRLKREETELAHTLSGAPIKDLRKGIGVNDKFVFISELFGGDEGLYEKSIKTINSLNILPEAEYWINRELKAKLGWSDTKETVQHFYSLVRRRFS